MKYIKVTGNILWGEETITKEDLGRIKNHQYDTIIDIEKLKYFDADENEWKDIPHTP